MKKSKPTLMLLPLILFLVQTTAAQGQALTKKNSILPASVTETIEDKDHNTGLVVTQPAAKLVAKFSAHFPGATNQVWRKVDNGYYVSFLDNNRTAKAHFSRKGNLNYAILDCTMNDLPSNLLQKIEKSYAGYRLVSAFEIKAYDALAHQVTLDNGTKYITLKATADGIEEVVLMKKAN